MRKGGCLCGRVRYRVRGLPDSVSVCHCATCRKASGAPSVAWAVFPLTDFAVTAGRMTLHASSPGVERGHCAECGTSITFFETGAATIDITLASLDDPEGLTPTREIWLSHRLAWEAVDEGRAGAVEAW